MFSFYSYFSATLLGAESLLLRQRWVLLISSSFFITDMLRQLSWVTLGFLHSPPSLMVFLNLSSLRFISSSSKYCPPCLELEISKFLHNILVPSGAIRGILLELSAGCRFICAIDGSELHEITQLRYTLASVLGVSASIIDHDVSVASSACGRVVNWSALCA